jgi:ribosomal 50S subunit-associated protein YjgA (DUF615 family)
VLERFIYRKIKLIYKFINKTKATKREETFYKYVLPQKSIDEVREDVEQWATENEEQLELLRRTEQFQKRISSKSITRIQNTGFCNSGIHRYFRIQCTY